MAEEFLEKILQINRKKYDESFPKFTQIFKVFFNIQKHTQEYKNVLTWLNAVADSFEISTTQFKHIINKSAVTRKLHTFLKNEENGFTQKFLKKHTHIYCFWKVLHWMCDQLQKYPRDENIFAFMTAHNISDVRVVIIGQDPAPGDDGKASTGFAYDGVDCDSTKLIIKCSAEEMNAIPKNDMAKIIQQMENIVVDDVNTNTNETEKINPDLGGWIKQNVLLMNEMLTEKKVCSQSTRWKQITYFFLDYIRKINNENPLVFIFPLSASYAEDKKQSIKNEHHIISVYHPSWTEERHSKDKKKREPYEASKSWEVVQPFTQANRHFCVNNRQDCIIDWDARLTQSEADMNRKEDIVMYFRNEAANNDPQ